MDVKIASVAHAVKFFEDLGKLVVDCIDVAKKRSIWGAIALIPEIELVIIDAKGALPELAHLSQSDSIAIGDAAYNCVKKIVAAA